MGWKSPTVFNLNVLRLLVSPIRSPRNPNPNFHRFVSTFFSSGLNSSAPSRKTLSFFSNPHHSIKPILHVLPSSCLLRILSINPNPDSGFLRSQVRSFSTSTPHQDENDDIVRSILSSIQSDKEEDDISFLLRLSSTFPETTLFSGLTLCRVVELSPSTATSTRFLRWVAMRPCADFDDDTSTLPRLVRLFVDRGDLDAAHDVVLLFRYAAGRSSLRAMLVILLEAFSEQQQLPPIDVASTLIGRMAHDKSLYNLGDSIIAGVCALHDLSFVNEAIALVKDQFFFWVSTMLSWADEINHLDDNGKRIAAQFAKEGLPKAATTAYNVILESGLTNRGRGFEVQLIDIPRDFNVILAEMDYMGITPDIGTFNIIAAYHDKASFHQSFPPSYYNVEKEEKAVKISSNDAVRLLDEMIRRGCKPDLEMYFLTARLLYRKGEASRAREMIDRAQSSVGIAFDAKSCHKFVMESHGMVELSRKMLEVMEGNGCVPMLETYRLLISELVWHCRLETAIDLYHHASKQHLGLLRLDLRSKVDEVLKSAMWGNQKDPSFLDFSEFVLSDDRDHIQDFPPPMVPEDVDYNENENFWDDVDHIELAYKDLCAARGRFLHLEANNAFPIVVEAYISVIVRIAWGVRSVSALTPLSKLDLWIRSLEGMESDAMDVGFLMERIKNLREMVDEYQRDEGYEIACVEEQRVDQDHKCKCWIHSFNRKSKLDLHHLMGRLMLSKGNALAESISEMALARW
ncbi:hypothetical protein QJS04_geneDACA022208 [Acorus gramineus]|uniref:Pentatricopeptide repeat-containing protein n=1 Tax=Acorus gramineus TaxID=55184 RepID=A0AAV9BCX5_ACOGR|nr:hypothetical protein QJS04_geneDACA022208 [Acorus gramineus]